MTNEEKREFLRLRMKLSQSESALRAIKARLENRADDLDLMLYGKLTDPHTDISFIVMATLDFLTHD